MFIVSLIVRGDACLFLLVLYQSLSYKKVGGMETAWALVDLGVVEVVKHSGLCL